MALQGQLAVEAGCKPGHLLRREVALLQPVECLMKEKWHQDGKFQVCNVDHQCTFYNFLIITHVIILFLFTITHKAKLFDLNMIKHIDSENLLPCIPHAL